MSEDGRRLPKRAGEERRRLPSWAGKVYRLLAAGRYASMWLLELTELYDIIAEEEGLESAEKWLTDELGLSISPSLVLRIFKFVRLVYRFGRTK